MLFRQQMNLLAKREITVKAFNTAEYGDGIAEKFLPIMDSEVKHFECWNKCDRVLFFPRQWKIEKKLQESYNIREFDLLHAHLMLSSGYTARKMKKKYEVPYVVSVRVTDLRGFIRLPYFRNMALKILQESNGILFLSHVHKKQLLEMYSIKDQKKFVDKISVIGNCIEPFWQENIVTEPRKIDAKKIRILTIAKIRPVKNIIGAAAAVDLLVERGYNAEFTVVGENQDEDEYKRILQYKNVRILPFMAKEELINIYHENDIFLLPSKEETFGRVYVEAMTQGLPILYSEGQGFDGNYPDGVVGYSVKSNDIVDIAKKIEEVIKNYSKLSDNALKRCHDFFEEEISSQLEKFYKNAIE